MQEKDMVNDVLSMVNSSLTGYANVISQTANQNLRQTLRQIRNSDEDFQFRLAQTATQKGYYNSAQPASETDISTVRSQLSGGGTSGQR
jgi:spore coat protein CotF